jgi:hypothetical protein
MLARLESKLPRGAQWRYEPKLDGFRGLLWRRTETGVDLVSRNMRDLSPWFPEIVCAGRALPVDTLVDGEIVIADEQGRSDSPRYRSAWRWPGVPPRRQLSRIRLCCSSSTCLRRRAATCATVRWSNGGRSSST